MADEDNGSAAGLRSFWSGTISFGLVSVPVALFPANRPRGVSLRMVDGSGTPVQRRYVCSKDEKPLDDDEIVRGYEVRKGKYVIIEDEELEAIEPRKSRDIDLRVFVPAVDIDPMYFERAYFLTPAGGSNKAYRLLARVMEGEGRAGIATFVMRDKEYLVAIIAENGILRAETLRFADEIRDASTAGLPKKPKNSAASVRKFERAIAGRTRRLDLRELTDPYVKRLEALVAKKRKAGDDIVKVKEENSAASDGGEVIDLLKVLSHSLGRERRPRARAKRSSKRPGKAK
jgi:DNA end-binding protein Ku